MTVDEPYNPSYTHWFGEPWPSPDQRAPICEDDRYRIDTPVDEACMLCNKPIEAEHRGVRYSASIVIGPDGESAAGPGQAAHIECNLRSVTGNHLHVAGLCRHRGDCNDLSNLSYREEALLVWEMQTGSALP